MELQIIPKQEFIPSVASNAVAVKHIEYYPYGETYDEDEITPKLISELLEEISKGIGIFYF